MNEIIVVYTATVGGAGMKVRVPADIAKDLGLRAWQNVDKPTLEKIQTLRTRKRLGK